MRTRTVRRLGLAAVAFWLVVGGYAVRERFISPGGEDWELSYAVFSTALPIAAALTLAVAAAPTAAAGRSMRRTFGLAVGWLGVFLGAIAAWAVPVWSVALAAGLAFLAAEAAGAVRRPLGLVAAGPALGSVTQFAVLGLGGGESLAADLAIIAAAAIAAVGLCSSLRRLAPSDLAAPPRVLPARP